SLKVRAKCCARPGKWKAATPTMSTMSPTTLRASCARSTRVEQAAIQRAQSRQVGGIDARLGPVEARAELAHEVEAELQRVEIDRGALLGIRPQDLDPAIEIGRGARVRQQRHANERDQQQRVAEAQVIDVDDAAQPRAI